MNPEFQLPPESSDFDRILEVDDTVDDVTEIRTILRERAPRIFDDPDA